MNIHVSRPGIPTYLIRLAAWHAGYGATAALCGLLLRMILPSVLYIFSLYAFAVYCAWTCILLLWQRPEAEVWSQVTPIAGLPMWIIPGTVVYGIAEFVGHGFVGTKDVDYNTPVSIALGLLVTLAIVVPGWLSVAGHHWGLAADADRSGQVAAARTRTSLAGRAARGAVFSLVLVFVLLQTRACDNRSLIHEAAERGWTTIVRVLIGIGQNPNTRTSRVRFPFSIRPDYYDLGLTPLHCAAQNGQWKTVRYLLGHGADVNARTEMGSDAAILAAKEGWNPDGRATLEIIIAAGADLRRKNKDGESVVDELRDWPKQDKELIDLAIAHGARPAKK